MVKVQLVLETGGIRAKDVPRGQPFLHVLFEQGLTSDKAVCAGIGLCGRCRVRFAMHPPDPCRDDVIRLGAVAVSEGWRLACRHAVSAPCRIEIPGDGHFASLPVVKGEALAVDIGTTRIKWAVTTGGIRGEEYAVANPQMGAGSEVMARLRYAMISSSSAEHLRSVVVDVIRSIVAGTNACRLAVSGNTTMIALLVGAPVGHLAVAPYAAPLSGGVCLSVAEDLPPAYVPPLLGAFIGADISAGLGYLCALPDVAYPFLLADLGTNGEFVLAVDRQTFVAASVPMGPAIEGVGLCCGAPAGPGVGSRCVLTPAGLVWDASPLSAISGTGVISLLAILRQAGLVDVAGHFIPARMLLGRRLEAAVEDHSVGRVFRLEGGAFLAERDIEEFLKVKAGVNAAVGTLLGAVDLPPTAVRKVYLAGALGEYSDPRDLFSLGLLPRVFEGRVVVAGNTSLAGTLKTLEEPAFRTVLSELASRVQVIDLVDQPGFASFFMHAMRFEWIWAG